MKLTPFLKNGREKSMNIKWRYDRMKTLKNFQKDFYGAGQPQQISMKVHGILMEKDHLFQICVPTVHIPRQSV